MEGWEEGRYVPFRDYYFSVDDPNVTDNGQRQEFTYPLSQPPAPLDWNITREPQDDYTDPRLSMFSDMLVSTAYASYHVPSGGIFPSTNHEGLYRSTGDLSVFMKPLYEADPELLQLQVLFFNEGAGSTLKFPAGPVAPLLPAYQSSGCDWITNLTNPYTGRAFGTPLHAEKCRTGPEIESRYYNSMETGAAEFILSNGLPVDMSSSMAMATSEDPVVWSLPQFASDNETMILRAGKAIYDRM